MSLTPMEKELFEIEYKKRYKDKAIVWALWLGAGCFGAHRLYLNKKRTGTIQLFTLGGFGIWAISDAFFINRMTAKYNHSLKKEIISEITQNRK